MKRIFKIIFVIEQRGGFDFLLPVIKKIQNSKEFAVFLFLNNKNVCQFAKKQKIRYRILINPSLEAINKIIKKINPDIILTDTNNTDFSFSIDKKFLLAAKKLDKPTISIIDSWVNYKERFGEKLEYLANNLLVIDKEMKKSLKSIGIPSNIIRITGSPRFDKFSNIKNTKEKKNLIVFYSQPLFKSKSNEVEIFKDIVSVLEKEYQKKEIIIKFHPTREENKKDKKKYDGIIKNSILKIKKAKKNIEAEDLSKKAELIIGINSMALIDSALMGKRVISYQPGINKKDDLLLSNKYNWSFPVYKKEDISSVLQDIFKKPLIKKDALKKYTKNNSTDKVITAISDILEKNMKRKKIICVIEARTGSTRLPKKVLLDLEGKPVLLRIVDRILESKGIDRIVVATTIKKEDLSIVNLIKGYHPKVDVFQGSEDDVADRYYNAAKKYHPDAVVRIAGDCPLIDPLAVNKVIDVFLKFNPDLASNVFLKRTYPRGLDTEVFSFTLLKKLSKELKELKDDENKDREHITTFVKRNLESFNCKGVFNDKDYSFHRWTLDEADDYKLIKIIYQELFKKNPNFRMKDIIKLFEKRPELIKINQYVEQKNPQY